MSVIVCTIVKNEASGPLFPKAVATWREIADVIVAVDNGSTDDTPKLLADHGAITHTFDMPMDGAETNARAFLWQKAIEAASDGDWLLWADADHAFAGDPRDFLAQTTRNRVCFPVYDMWTPTAYRSDAWWRVRPWWQGVRWGPWATGVTWQWPDRGWHSGHVPSNAPSVFGPAANVPDHCGLLHYGYATPELRERHAAAYVARAHVLTQAERFHASTILDERPRLVGLPFEPRWRLLG